MEMAEEVARLMAEELGWDKARIDKEVAAYHALATGYLLT
jgi:flavodoxin